AVGDDSLTRFEVELAAVEVDVDLVGFEGHQVADTRHLWTGADIRPRRAPPFTDVVVAGQSFVGAECLSLDWTKERLGDVLTAHIPARGETGFEENQRLLCVRDYLVTVANDQTPRCGTYVDTMVEFGRVSDDALVFFIEGVHRAPG